MKQTIQEQYMLYDHIKLIMGEHLKDEHQKLMNSSKGKDIVVLLGSTGSGKSTLMNFIINKELFINYDEEIELMNPDDPSAMKIGLRGESETIIPKSAQVGRLTYYDLPGIHDNRGTAINLVNATFIKRIIESAKTVRLIFVAGQDELTASRGETFKSLLQTINILLPGSDALQISSFLIITKSLKSDSIQLIDFLQKKIENSDILKIWLNQDRIQPMSKRIDQTQRNDTIQKIQDITPQKIDYVNIEAIYGPDVKNDLRQIFEIEMSNSLEKIYKNSPKNHSTIKEIESAKFYLQNSFTNDVLLDLATSTIVELLKPLSEQIYSEELSKLSNYVKEKINLNITQLDLKNQQLVNEEQREKAEKELAILATAMKNLEQVLEEIQARNDLNDLENWPVIVESKKEILIYWGEKYYGDKKVGKISAFVEIQDLEIEIKVSVVSQRTVKVQPNTGKIFVIEDWKEVSKTEMPTGKTKFIGWQNYNCTIQ